MKIIKFQKDKKNTYQMILEEETLTVYEDILIKYELLRKKEITEKELQELKRENEEYTSFQKSLSYLAKKMRTEKEIDAYLKKAGFFKQNRQNTIEKLKQFHYLDDQKYIIASLNDTLKFSNDGPYKIQKKLEALGLNKDQIIKALEEVPHSLWEEKIAKIIQKKIASNHKESQKLLKKKIENYLEQNGYSRNLYQNILDKSEIPQSKSILLKEYEKQKRQLARKYNGQELTYQIKRKLYLKGFTKEEIESIL